MNYVHWIWKDLCGRTSRRDNSLRFLLHRVSVLEFPHWTLPRYTFKIHNVNFRSMGVTTSNLRDGIVIFRLIHWDTKVPLLDNDSEIIIPEPLLGEAFANRTGSHGKDLSNYRRSVFLVGPSREVISETHSEVSWVHLAKHIHNRQTHLFARESVT
jgi:hypothetical protein